MKLFIEIKYNNMDGVKMEDYMNKTMLQSKVEAAYEWREWGNKIPYINIPDKYKLKIIPPFGGAIARFIVADKNDEKRSVSVYLDCYEQLGYFGEPYWELYPYIDGDVYRCAMDDVDNLVARIVHSIEVQK